MPLQISWIWYVRQVMFRQVDHCYCVGWNHDMLGGERLSAPFQGSGDHQRPFLHAQHTRHWLRKL